MKSVPVYDPITFVQNVANGLAADFRGAVPDTRLIIAITKALAARPEMIIHEDIARRLFNKWHRVSNRILNKAPGLYIPSLFVKPAKGVTIRQRECQFPDLDSWINLDRANKATIDAAFDRRIERLETWCLDMRKTRLATLWEVQRDVYGFDEAKAKDPFASRKLDDDDDEDEPV